MSGRLDRAPCKSYDSAALFFQFFGYLSALAISSELKVFMDKTKIVKPGFFCTFVIYLTNSLGSSPVVVCNEFKRNTDSLPDVLSQSFNLRGMYIASDY